MSRYWAIFLGLSLLLASCRHDASPRSRPAARLFLEARGPDTVAWVLPQSGVRIETRSEPLVTSASFKQIDVVSLGLGEGLLVGLDERGSDALARQTQAGNRIVLVVGDRALGVVRLDRPVADGHLAFLVEVPEADLRGLAASLRPSFWKALTP